MQNVASKATMPDQLGSDELFVEIDGEKFKADPDNLKEALKDKETGEPIPFEEKPKEEKVEVKKEEKEEKIPIRRSAKDFIIDRKTEKIRKLEEAKKEEKKEEEEEEFTLEGRKLIDKKIAERIKEGFQPILDSVTRQEDRQELGEVLEKYGDLAKKLKKKIVKYMNHPAYKTVPVEFIFLGLASDEVRKAKKKKEADDEAEEGAIIGDQKRVKKIAKIPDVTKMTDKEVGELVHKVRTGQF